MVHHSNCPGCNSRYLSRKFKLIDHFVSGEIFEILKCDDCGLILTQDYPEENQIQLYYHSDEYISHSDTTSGIINRIYHFIRGLMLRRKSRMIVSDTNKNIGKLIDIGCGTGYFLAYMKAKEWDTIGFEINEKAKNIATDKFGLEVHDPKQIDKIENTSIDCVTMWHVLEHFHDPSKVLNSIQRILKDDGVLVIALPNNDSYDAKYYKENWAAWDVPRHLWHFNPSSFKIYIEKYGFRIRKIRRLPFDSFYVSILSEKYTGKKMPGLRGMVIGKISWLISMFYKHRTSSVVYIIEKKKD